MKTRAESAQGARGVYLCWSKGSRLKRTEAEKMTGSCGMMPRRARSTLSGTVRASTPSMKMVPPASSWMRNSAIISELLPLPVRPATPIFSPPLTLKLRPLSTSGPSR